MVEIQIAAEERPKWPSEDVCNDEKQCDTNDDQNYVRDSEEGGDGGSKLCVAPHRVL